jgi:hypothetical protein
MTIIIARFAPDLINTLTRVMVHADTALALPKEQSPLINEAHKPLERGRHHWFRARHRNRRG